MTNLTALLLVLTLTGAPVASVVCAAECNHKLAAEAHCHGDMTESDSPIATASYSCNDLSLGESPYVVEHRSMPGAAVLINTLSSTAPVLVMTVEPAVRTRAADAWLTSPQVLRL
jgi:hypothetical protein